MPKLPAGLTALNTTQFLGAMNDNILKLLIIFFLIHSQGTGKAGIITAMAGAAFVLPFLIFSAPAGCLFCLARAVACFAQLGKGKTADQEN